MKVIEIVKAFDIYSIQVVVVISEDSKGIVDSIFLFAKKNIYLILHFILFYFD